MTIFLSTRCLSLSRSPSLFLHPSLPNCLFACSYFCPLCLSLFISVSHYFSLSTSLSLFLPPSHSVPFTPLPIVLETCVLFLFQDSGKVFSVDLRIIPRYTLASARVASCSTVVQTYLMIMINGHAVRMNTAALFKANRTPPPTHTHTHPTPHPHLAPIATPTTTSPRSNGMSVYINILGGKSAVYGCSSDDIGIEIHLFRRQGAEHYRDVSDQMTYCNL